MSVYLPKGKSPFYAYDFQFRGERFHGSTGCSSRREAEQVEKAKREELKQIAKANPRQKVASLQIDHAAERYYQEVGQHHVNANSTERNLARLIEYFGPDKLITEISDAEVSALVAKRRAERRIPHNRPKGKKAADYPLISPATVNRSTTQVLKKLINHAKRAWKVRFENEPEWKLHTLKETEERVRELVGKEADQLEAATRDDFLAFFEYVRSSGWRQEACVDLRWPEINWEGRQIRKRGKGGRFVTLPITSHIRSILEPLIGHHPEFVFTYVAARTIRPRKAGQTYARTGNRSERGEAYVAERDQEERIKGRRYPMTLAGVKAAWTRLRKKAKVQDFRFHDFRHNFATKLLRSSGNLKLVSRALNHSKLETTMRYAHVLDQDIAEALEDVQSGLLGRSDGEGHRKSRSKSRNGLKPVS